MAEQYTGAGVDQIILASRGRDPNDYLERLSQMADELVEPAAPDTRHRREELTGHV